MHQIHYFCEKCGGVSPIPKACGTEGCELNGHPLTECHCEIPEHLEILQKATAKKEENDQN